MAILRIYGDHLIAKIVFEINANVKMNLRFIVY